MSALAAIGSLIPLLMVPRGRYEPEYQIGHTRISSSNKNYVETQVGDDAINGGLVNTLTLLHAARVTELAVTSVFLNDHCSNEWPPWPNFGRDSEHQCGAFETCWNNKTIGQDHNSLGSLQKFTAAMQQQQPFYVTVETEAGFLEKIRVGAYGTTQTEPPKSGLVNFEGDLYQRSIGHNKFWAT